VKFLDHKKEKYRTWADKHAAKPNSRFWLGVLSFAESSFFPIPPDFLLIAILMTKERPKWLSYSLVTTIASVLGGVFAYLIGFVFFKTAGASLVHFYHLEANIASVQGLFISNAFAAVIFAAFMPIPEAYKVSALAAGLFHANIFVFIIASLVGRGARFFAVGFVMHRFGERLSNLIYDYFTAFFIGMIALLGIIIYLLV
jgi:membrane protein YqaA with SNARE-associated domain